MSADLQGESTVPAYAALLAHATDGYLYTDALGTIRASNEAAARVLGIRTAFLLDKPLVALVVPADRWRFLALLHELREGTAAGEWSGVLESPGGKRAAAMLTALPRRQAEQVEGIDWLLRAAEPSPADGRQEADRQRALLARLPAEVLASLDPGSLLQSVVRRVATVLEAEYVVIWLVQGDRHELHLAAQAGFQLTAEAPTVIDAGSHT